MKLDPYLKPYTKITSKWINIRPVTTKTRRKQREKFLNIDLGNDFLDMTLKEQATKAKIDK